MAQVTVEQLAGEISALLESHLGVKGRDLAQQLRRAGRQLPSAVRRDAEMVSQAVALSRSSKLQKQVNIGRIEAAERRVSAYLKSIDRTEQRITGLIGVLASIAFGLLVLTAAVIGVLVWRGLI